jgi:hypothetical protein
LVADEGERGEQEGREILLDPFQERRERAKEMKSTANDELFAEKSKLAINDSVGRNREGCRGGSSGGGSRRRICVLDHWEWKDGGRGGRWVRLLQSRGGKGGRESVGVRGL